GWGLATDYEVFLVSRMVEARESGMSTSEAIRIGTATTGRLITAAALIMAVVAGSFVFSDLVMMKYLAFGLMAALLLDATVVRMFLVPSVMKLLGDDCWWAPRWMKRLQTRIGLGEIRLPDERKRPAAHRRPERSPVAARDPVTTKPRPPHDPTHPSVKGSARPRPPVRTDYRPPVQDTPSTAGTTRMRIPGSVEPEDATTTRFAAPAPGRGSERRSKRSDKPAQDREIESWLSELREPKHAEHRDDSRGSDDSAQSSRAEPAADRSTPASGDGNEATTAIPVPPENNDPERATDNLNSRGNNSANAKPGRPRRGGGLSAQDLLRREGRF
ncbi:MAG: MMPL family transporter, partial [Mycobacterium sp.]